MGNQSEIINSFVFETRDDGALEVSFNNEKNTGKGKVILIFLVSLAAIISAFFIEGDLQYVLWIIGGMVFLLSLFGITTLLSPSILLVTEEQIQFKGRLQGKSVYNKDEIEDITYEVEQINRSATSMMGKEDVPMIRMQLKNGSNPDLLMIEKRKSGMTRTYEEEAEAKKIINLIKKTLEL